VSNWTIQPGNYGDKVSLEAHSQEQIIDTTNTDQQLLINSLLVLTVVAMI